ncbi:MAG: hypothetical protein ACUVS7_17770 [Bryobacteraceae bacterium]
MGPGLEFSLNVGDESNDARAFERLLGAEADDQVNWVEATGVQIDDDEQGRLAAGAVENVLGGFQEFTGKAGPFCGVIDFYDEEKIFDGGKDFP